LAIVLNLIAFWAAGYFLAGFHVVGGIKGWVVLALILALLNFVVKPILKLILGPIIVITLGLGIILVNMIVLYLLDKIADNLSIDGVLTLFYAALIVGLGNFIFHLAIKRKHDQ